eukprot:scaffold7328_cov314-Pinguiococcus_pyrenoidosus.AAC.49
MQRSAEEPAESAAAGAPDPDPVEDLQGPEASSRAPDTGIDAQDAPDAPDSGGSESPPKVSLAHELEDGAFSDGVSLRRSCGEANGHRRKRPTSSVSSTTSTPGCWTCPPARR